MVSCGHRIAHRVVLAALVAATVHRSYEESHLALVEVGIERGKVHEAEKRAEVERRQYESVMIDQNVSLG